MRVNQLKLSEIFGVSARAVRDWDKAGCPSHQVGKSKEYVPADVIAWRIAREIEAAEGAMPLDMSDESIKNAQRAKLIADADKAQAVAEMAMLELAQKRRDMVPREVAEGVLSDIIAELSQALDRIPYRYPAELGACRNDNERREVLRRAVDEARTTMSKVELEEEQEEDQANGANQASADE